MTRSDARRNRDRVLAAAEDVFGEYGTGASTEDVARRAGVGIGTVFRHFPSKDALLMAVYVRHLERAADTLDALETEADPAAALAAFFEYTLEQSRLKSAVADALAARDVDIDSPASQPGLRLEQGLGGLLDRAQANGTVRGNVGVADLIALLVGVTRAAEYAGWDTDSRARILAVVLDGIRGPSGSPRRLGTA